MSVVMNKYEYVLFEIMQLNKCIRFILFVVTWRFQVPLRPVILKHTNWLADMQENKKNKYVYS